MKVGLIGTGMVARTYADAIASSKVVALGPVYSRNPLNRDAFLASHPALDGSPAFDVDQIANDHSVDFAIVITPPDARLEIVETLARAGKPILMEKPVERTLENATHLVELCEDLGVPLGIVLQHRARPVVAELNARRDQLGPLLSVEVDVPWWRPQEYYDQPGRGTYARDGGGVLITQAIHTMDLMVSLTGPVRDVTAMCATTGAHNMEAEDFVVAGLSFENGAFGKLFATTAGFPGSGETISLHCRDGSARLEAGILRLDYRDGTSETVGRATSSGAGADPMAFTSDWHRAMIEDFAEAIREGRPPLVPGRAALEVHRLIAAIEKAGETGKRVTLERV
ncbi:Gfo/Idh/MocA family oxidoreductase [Silicimonas algicola]|uniref:Putative dehydrogenase n=1 Tax=Silicimonas algicola TaxID=1826607 RepID=A0A316G2I9_9RHOB|nr:Gfo/Idh/MocA family oxidoreductase [Silicimonas algicola]AZQ69171.1 Gfo/Idh/MocA family oxidoreductase [Silicimonas algicola]PWK55018.1 putative dehydrogenase [Silicimonas algicola]